MDSENEGIERTTVQKLTAGNVAELKLFHKEENSKAMIHKIYSNSTNQYGMPGPPKAVDTSSK